MIDDDFMNWMMLDSTLWGMGKEKTQAKFDNRDKVDNIIHSEQ